MTSVEDIKRMVDTMNRYRAEFPPLNRGPIYVTHKQYDEILKAVKPVEVPRGLPLGIPYGIPIYRMP